MDFESQDKELSRRNGFNIHPNNVTWKTGLIYDQKMCEYFNLEDKNHVERPARISSIYNALNKNGLTCRCQILKSRFASHDEILLKHNEHHLKVIESLSTKTDEELGKMSCDYDSIYFHPNSSESSFLSVGCTLEVVEQVLKKNILNGVAIVRPPGHHALTHCSMGFCHFNNVAIAAEYAVKKYGLKRVLIVDWDIHFGNGIHKMFENDNYVLYFSMHRYDNQRFWPCLAEGNYNSIGKGDGEGFNVNVAWNKSGMNDADYILAFKHVLLPIAKEYNPELVLVSAGFDSGKGDPLGNCKVTPAGYAQMTKELMSLADGKVVIVLEGGYNLKTLASSMSSCLATLLGDPINVVINSNKSSLSAKQSVAKTLFAIQKYWKSLNIIDQMFFDVLKLENVEQSSSLSTSSDEDIDLVMDGLTQISVAQN
ncbi:polyamine deacetylase HDAC10 [Hydra vulgaris]|uniref:polyamine deacetylase HDAC10 n=1 Tax=Hydra vulgaris TaxID=6087 RepID=UPI001F5E66C3|nr:polyamine deacetylase HDAC10 [Hydra vulgaris]